MLAASAASAQAEADFIAAFAGHWKVFDDSFADAGEKCTLTLENTGSNGRYGLQSDHCSGELKSASKWGIVESQLALLDQGDRILVRLGGNQRRMTGTTANGKPVVFDRAAGGGLAGLIQAALKASGCYYLGFGDKCAPAEELTSPVAGAEETKIKTVVNLNVRAEARDDAAVVGVIPQNSCVSVETCLTASDGVWCQARFGEKNGWLRKVALRQNRWPIVTFVNACDSGG